MAVLILRIHNGETAADLGLTDRSYQRRKEALAEFLKVWDGDDFETSFVKWEAAQIPFDAQHSISNYKNPLFDATGQSRGLGDTVAKLTSAIGIKPCGACKQRQKKLNDLVPYKVKR